MLQRYAQPRPGTAPVVLVAIAIVAVLGCAIVDNTEPISDEVVVHTTGAHVLVSNGLDATVYYFMVGRQLSFLIDWVPHLDEDQSIASGENAAIPYEDIMMNSDTGETQVVVYWWQATMREGKRVPGDIRSVVVDL